MRLCKVCGASFKARTNYKCCSDDCSAINQKRRMKAWNEAHPERMDEYRKRFISALENPPIPNAELLKLLLSKSPW